MNMVHVSISYYSTVRYLNLKLLISRFLLDKIILYIVCRFTVRRRGVVAAGMGNTQVVPKVQCCKMTATYVVALLMIVEPLYPPEFLSFVSVTVCRRVTHLKGLDVVD